MEELRKKLLIAASSASSILPKGYMLCEYIESSGSQYIDTGVSGGSNAAYEIDFERLGRIRDYEQYFAGEQPPVNVCKLYCSNSSPYKILVEAHNGQGNVSFALDTSFNTRYSIRFNSDGSILLNGVIQDGTSSVSNTYKGKGWGSVTWWVFGSHGEPGLMSVMRLYSLKMWTDGVIIRDFIPCMNPDGEYGLYDLVEEKFYPNQGTGQFTGKLTDNLPPERLQINVIGVESGYTISIIDGDGNVIGTQTSSYGEYSIPVGTVYTISSSDVDGYVTPSNRSFTAVVGKRVVNIEYIENPYGVYIQDTTGRLWKTEEWNGSATASSVVVYDAACNPFGIVTTFDGTSRIFADLDSGIHGHYCTKYNTEAKARGDYNGYGNCISMINYDNEYSSIAIETSSAIYRAWNNKSIIVNNKAYATYLPSVGQLALIYSYKSSINAALSKIGKSNVPEVEMWASTVANYNYGASETWCDRWVYNMSTGVVSYFDGYQTYAIKKRYITIANVEI